jgi:hypothetical protein
MSGTNYVLRQCQVAKEWNSRENLRARSIFIYLATLSTDDNLGVIIWKCYGHYLIKVKTV